MRVDLVGDGAVVGTAMSVRGPALGGRRARVTLAVLALAEGPLDSHRLASIIWGDALPPTWQPALRGIVRGLRAALTPLDGGGSAVIETTSTGYRLAEGVEVDVRAMQRSLGTARALAGEGRHAAVLEIVEPLTRLTGEQLLAGDHDPWLEPHRAALDEVGMHALELAVDAAGALGEHRRAIAAARHAVAVRPLDERAHRSLIAALDRAGDRAGAVQAYEQCRAALADQLGVDPSSETVSAYLAALADQAATAAAAIPTHATSFVGREAERAQVAAALDRPGLVMVAGRGGVGKSRLAADVAAGRAMRAEFTGGRYWVSLATAGEDALVAATVALELGVPVGAEDTETVLAQHLAPYGRTLLVLDGAELVLDGTASLAAALVAACPFLTVLVTSRVPLGLRDDVTIEVAPLPVPADASPAALRANPQVRLLADRVRSDGGQFEIDDRSAPVVAALCRRCDGLPLALELAAAQLVVMPVGDLLDQLADVDLAGDDRLRAIARNSYEQLDPDEAAVFRRMAVLDGPSGLSLIRSVASGPDVAPVRVVRILRELSARGLVVVDRSGPRWRYQHDDDLHRYARELLAEDGGERAAFDRLADAVAALLPDDARSAPAPYADDVTALLGSLRSLFVAAIDGRSDRARCLELAFRLHRYWAATTVVEGRYWLARLLGLDVETPWRRYATFALGYLSYWAGDTDDALRDLQAALRMFGSEPDPYAARAFIYVAGLLDDLDRPDEALAYVRRSIAAAEPFGTDLYVAAAMGLGSVLSERGDREAERYAGEAVARCRVDGSAEQLSALLPTAAMVCWQVGALDEARSYVREARPMHVSGRRIARVVLLSTAAGIALADGDIVAAIQDGTVADTEATALGVEREVPLIRSVLARALLASGDTAAAAAAALAAIEAAAAMTVGFPLAVCLETAALVAAGCASAGDVATVLAVAAELRSRGDRPAPATLRVDVERLRAEVGAAAPVEVPDSVAIARRILGPLAG